MQASAIDPHDATILANQSLCWLKLREGERAVSSAQQCRRLRPGWAKAWYREGAALSLLQVHTYGSHVTFSKALQLTSDLSICNDVTMLAIISICRSTKMRLMRSWKR